jgi:glutamyl-tRNA reductase
MSGAPALHLTGLSHHTADVAIRERLVLCPDTVSLRLQAAAAAGRSLVILSTCNRFELYWWGDDDQEAQLWALAAEHGLTIPRSQVYRYDGVEAVRHLFAVASGLDSQVLGELEILTQVRRAHRLAVMAGATRPELDLSFAAAITAGRRARRESLLGRHPASISAAAVEHAAHCFGGSLAASRVLVLGAGQVAGGLLRSLAPHRPGRVIVLGRNPERSSALAAATPGAGARVGRWEGLKEAIGDSDLVLAATASQRPVLDETNLPAALAGRPTPMVVLDLGVPRNVDPAVRDLPGLHLFDLDDLRLQHCPAEGPASPALDEARRILEHEIGRFERALRRRAAAPALTELHRLGAAMAREEAERALAELGLGSEEKSEIVRRMAERLARRLLYPASRTFQDS